MRQAQIHEAEGYPAWAALPLVSPFLKLSQISRTDVSSWFGWIQSSIILPPSSREREQDERYQIEMQMLRVKLAGVSKRKTLPRAICYLLMLQLCCCSDLDRIGRSQQLAHAARLLPLKQNDALRWVHRFLKLWKRLALIGHFPKFVKNMHTCIWCE